MDKLKILANSLQDRRKNLRLSQKDMLMKVGMTQQQYQRIENGSDTRVSTLLRIIEGLRLELMLIPKEYVYAIQQLLDQLKSGAENIQTGTDDRFAVYKIKEQDHSEIYWHDLDALKDDPDA